jgi:regulator of sigma E protease
MITTILLFLAVLFVLVLVHEWGHYITAKKTGMRVDEFGIGFPPKLFGFKRGETEYTLNALPLGGFVRIYGESLVHEAAEEHDPDKARALWARPAWAQALVLIAGVVMNVVLAYVLYVAVFMIGVPTPVPETEQRPGAELYIASVVPDSPLAGLVTPGTVVKAVTAADGTTLDELTPSAFSSFVGSYGAEPLALTIQDGEEERIISVLPEAGLITDAPERRAVGVALTLVVVDTQGFLEALQSAGVATITGLGAIVAGVAHLLGGAFTGTADLSQVAGPVGIAGMVGDAAEFGIPALLSFVAIISLNLAVVNMLPFPALDGGRLLLLLGEVVLRRPANALWTHRLNAAGFILLMVFMVVVTYNDIMRLF